eukprot:SAG11_NODE_1309_length_5238_cov_64.494260_2_plen_48_part_00
MNPLVPVGQGFVLPVVGFSFEPFMQKKRKKAVVVLLRATAGFVNFIR